MNTFPAADPESAGYTVIPCVLDHEPPAGHPENGRTLLRHIDPRPFVPAAPETLDERCADIFAIQAAGLAKRLRHTGIRHAVIGLSGGLDSTLALLVTTRAFDLLGIPREQIVGITMPGFGTTGKTKSNAKKSASSLGITLEEIRINKSVTQHFKDIGQDADTHDVTYENAQARERTQILMDRANMLNALVIGTGDLSELALGWATYNGDHMSMYAVNASIPKTLVRHLVGWCARQPEQFLPPETGEGENSTAHRQFSATLQSVLDTPVSPELLPAEEDEIQQKTEEIVGPYELHDFFLYHMMRWGCTPAKILYMAEHAFGSLTREPVYTREDILKWMNVFYRRFFSQQFKRSCLPDGPKVGSVSLSPRSDWRMPSDASAAVWLKELESLS